MTYAGDFIAGDSQIPHGVGSAIDQAFDKVFATRLPELPNFGIGLLLSAGPLPCGGSAMAIALDSLAGAMPDIISMFEFRISNCDGTLAYSTGLICTVCLGSTNFFLFSFFMSDLACY